jgi:AP-3 complex subunit beta
MIIPVVVAAVAGGAKDSSPYVRKTSAHAIPKIYSVDPSQKEVLVELIEKLLKDRSPMVLGSAVASFNEVCPDRFDLVHANFRKFCDLLADVDAWGQVPILNMLTRYGRSQFVDPDKPKEEQKDEDNKDDLPGFSFSGMDDLDPDHRILLDSAHHLLYSDNAAVVMAVATLYYYLAPGGEKAKVGKAVCRLVRNAREMQFCVLSSILHMANTNPDIFQPYLTDFFCARN